MSVTDIGLSWSKAEILVSLGIGCVTVFGNVAVSWRESSWWLSLLKPILHDWWLVPKQVLHTIRSGHIFHKELGVWYERPASAIFRIQPWSVE